MEAAACVAYVENKLLLAEWNVRPPRVEEIKIIIPNEEENLVGERTVAAVGGGRIYGGCWKKRDGG